MEKARVTSEMLDEELVIELRNRREQLQRVDPGTNWHKMLTERVNAVHREMARRLLPFRPEAL